MPEISVGSHGGMDSALRRFKKRVERGGVFSGVRGREFYEKPSERKKEYSQRKTVS